MICPINSLPYARDSGRCDDKSFFHLKMLAARQVYASAARYRLTLTFDALPHGDWHTDYLHGQIPVCGSILY